MSLNISDIQKIVSERFGNDVAEFEMVQDIFTFTVNAGKVKQLIAFMKEDETLRFNFLTDLCGLHLPDNAPEHQFAVVYLLHNWVDNIRVRVKTFLPANKPEVESVTEVFATANWMERETYDFFGIIFKGHPNLKRILNHDGMTDFPMRKEFPLEDQYRTDKDDRFFGREVNPNSVGKA